VPEPRETILVVDDEPMVLRIATTSLERFGFNVLAASRADDALNLCRHHQGFIHLALLDVLKAGMHGFIQNLTTLLPGIRIVIMSGYDLDEIISQGCIPRTPFSFIQKPFRAEALATCITEILARPATFAA
jgi:DNA-binding NtrC family response regulator